MLSLRVIVEPGVVVMKEYYVFSKALEFAQYPEHSLAASLQ